MSGVWLVSYIVLWAVVLAQGGIIFILLRQLGVIYLGSAQGVAGDGLAVGANAPDFAATSVAGESVTLASFAGRPLLLIFGSPTCAPCKALIPDLNVFSAERRAELAVLFLSHGDADATRRMADEHRIAVPVAHHPDDRIANAYQARVTPFAFLIDGDGVIRAKGLANNREHLEMLVRNAKDAKAKGAGHNGTSAEAPAEAPVETVQR